MVSTVSRALTSLLAALLVLLCAPLTAGQERDGGPPPSPQIPSAGFWPHAVAGPISDSASISLALAKWSGEQRVPPRDLPDGYVPPAIAVRGPGQARGWVPLPGPPPLTGAATEPGLPPGRAPPLTTLT